MNDLQWNDTVKRLKEGLPVNEELKEQLRNSFMRNRKKKYLLRWTVIAAALLCLVMLNTVWQSEQSIPKVEAASLQLSNQFSLIEQLGKENSAGVAEYEGTIYFPLQEKGLYAYGNHGFHKLADGDIRFVRVSPNGKQLVYVQEGSLYLYEVDLKTNRLLLQGGKEQGFYETPSWSPDGTRIAFVKRMEFNEHDEENLPGLIAELDVKKGEIDYIAEGMYPSYVSGRNTLFFERNNKIISRNLNNGEETVLDAGKYPAVSNDGSYVAYVKSQGEPLLEDVWIADTNFKTKKQLTENQLAEAWDRQTGEMIEGKQQARYTFEQPTWSRDDRTLFVYKIFHTNEVWKKLMRFELTTAKPEPEDIVKGSIQALIYRDEDYAHSFFSYDPGYLKGTSPRQIGYKLIDSGKLDGETFVDAETYLSYADPYYQIIKTRYFLSDGPKGYRIDNMEEKVDIEISMWGEAIYKTVNGVREQQPLLELKDLPKKDKWTDEEICNIVYQESTETLWFTLKRKQDAVTALSLLSYDIEEKQFKEIDTFHEAQSSSMMIIDDEQKYVAIDMEINGNKDTVVYHLHRGQKTILSRQIQGIAPQAVHVRFWENGKLIFYTETEDRDVFFRFDPETNNIDTTMNTKKGGA
ncbi:Tol-Pal system protein TolB [Paenibacillus sp. CECT 9249]|uniref:hypothetical protein n=1 Tax=Paenibacillus sp. CECT 9249 TaxID=2845385 RepID=UPI001E53D7F4|nr:hypothetical protein [Paenibacillus sp. CECT 9249]CAH0121929.1 Tol-Pal system protein TolB [Paenibacillus sp. CECT 9249]